MFAVGAIWEAAKSFVSERSIAFWGSLASVVVLALLVHLEWVSPYLRTFRLKRPVKAHFTIRQVPGSDIEPHHVGRLVLPSHKEVEVEVGIHALTNFRASEVIFGCKGDEEVKPAVTGRARQFVKTGNLPEPVYYIDHADWCHAVVNRDYNKGTHHVMGFQVRTRDEGLFEAVLSFVTDEIEGNYDRLEILVEDRPHTVMYCHAKEHGRYCWINPATVVAPKRVRRRAPAKSAHGRKGPP
jgi:hypothetical protein